jgi:hypothetical protein
MKQLQLMFSDGKRSQRGSVLSALLVIVAFLSILIGALLTELTDSFVVSRDLVAKVTTQATVTSGAELAIHNLQTLPVPPVCSHDARGPWPLTLNGHPATVTQTCTAIVPEQTISLRSGNYNVDGIHDTVGGRNRYLVADAGGHMSSYSFGQTGTSWSIQLGGAPTAPPLTAVDPEGSINILVPVAKNGPGCGGHCVVAFNEDAGSVPQFTCNLAADATVSARPAVEVTAGGSATSPVMSFWRLRPPLRLRRHL